MITQAPFTFDSTIHEILNVDTKTKMPVTLYISVVQAGFPSPAEDYVEGKLDLNQHLIKHKAATFFVRAAGDSMKNAGIFPGDLLIVDRSLEAKAGNIVIAALNGELTVKRLKMLHGAPSLSPENSTYSDIKITKDDDFSIWGVVTNVIHSLT